MDGFLELLLLMFLLFLQVEKNLVKDVLLKIATNVEHHRKYNDTLNKSQRWIEEARDIVKASSDADVESSKEKLQQRLHQVRFFSL